ncbi:D-alanyl-D-alanine carboxypeptidase family protein [Micropruina sp.]|uniref:M15 family metallopeptidase n=1 Tax=Micropruina sp. TaxID=2737536 RepID=UPI0039E3BEC7
MTLRRRWLATAAAAVVLGLGGAQLAGCSAADAPAVPGSEAGASPAGAQTGVPTATPSTGVTLSATPSIDPSPSDALRPSTRPVDERTGKELGRPFTVNGIVVVSAEHPVSAGYRPTIGDFELTPTAAKAFRAMQRAIEKAGLRLYVVSGYRSYAEQKALYTHRLATMGRAYTRKYVAVPGASEHQTGLAVDLRSPSGRGTSFVRTREWRWLRAHAQNYGFVLRYPEGKTKLTGIGFEPWHWRYVGVQQAKAIRALGADVTIEQYLRLA